jgi:hypothetical protein
LIPQKVSKMNLANTSPKQLRRLSASIAESDETLAEFLSSLQSTLLAFPLDKGAFRDELFMLGADLFNAGVLAAAGEARIAHVLAAVPAPTVEVFLEGVDETFAKSVRREINITSHTAEKLAPSAVGSMYRYFGDIALQGVGVKWADLLSGRDQEVDHFLPKAMYPLFPWTGSRGLRKHYTRLNKEQLNLLIEDLNTGGVTSLSPELQEKLQSLGILTLISSAGRFSR